MNLPANPFKAALREGRTQIGLWLALADANCAEVCAAAGYDWLLIDVEHAPNDIRSILAQLRAVAAYPVAPVVRIASPDPVAIKQVLDLGCANILVPMVETPEQAASLARAMRYPPAGMRGVGSGLARASRWSRLPRYLQEADEQACLLVQVESVKGLGNLSAIAAVDGVDGVFIGPADLAADMGKLGRASDPDVLEVILKALGEIAANGKPSGILATTPSLAERYLAAGAAFVAVGSDAILLARAADELAERSRELVAAIAARRGG